MVAQCLCIKKIGTMKKFTYVNYSRNRAVTKNKYHFYYKKYLTDAEQKLWFCRGLDFYNLREVINYSKLDILFKWPLV